MLKFIEKGEDMSNFILTIENTEVVQKKDHQIVLKDVFADEKFMELLIHENVIHPTFVGNTSEENVLSISKKCLYDILLCSKKVYGGLYGGKTPRFAQKYPNESTIEFMKRWGGIITELEEII